MIRTLGFDSETWVKHTRATLRFDARSETELGTLRSYIETRFDYMLAVKIWTTTMASSTPTLTRPKLLLMATSNSAASALV